VIAPDIPNPNAKRSTWALVLAGPLWALVGPAFLAACGLTGWVG